MTASNWIRFFLLGSDPGLAQNKQAAKTVLAVAVTLFLFWNAHPVIRLYAGMCAGFLMQCTAEKTRREKQICLLTVAAATAVTAGVENSLDSHALPKEILLIGAAFTVYYVRQFIPGKAGFPLFGFTLSVIASIHAEDAARGLWHSMAVLSGGMAAYLVYFFVLPNESLRAFRHALQLFVYRSKLLLEAPPLSTSLVAVLVVTDTIGSSLQKITQRVGMTAAGCAAGWYLHWLASGRPHLQIVFLLISIFLAAFFRKTSYPLMTFSITVYVAFLFSVIGQWSAELLGTRLLDTAIGGGIAVFATFIVPAPRVSHVLESDLVGFWQTCRTHVETAFALLRGTEPELNSYDWEGVRRDLLERVELLRMRFKESFYEQLLQTRSRKRNERIVRNTALLCHHALGFGRMAHLRNSPMPQMERWQPQITQGFNRLRQFHHDDTQPASPKGEPWPVNDPEPVFYFARRIDELLTALNRDL